MKKIVTVALVILMATMVFAGGSGDSDKLLAVVTPSATHGFTGESVQHCEAQVKALAEEHGFDYRFMTAAESGEQSNAVDTIMAMGPDAFVLWPVNGDEMRSAAQTISDAGIPLIVYDRFIPGFVPTAEISGDNVQIGVDTGNYYNEYFADDLARGQVNYLEFKGDSSTVPQERTDGFEATADDNFNLVQSFVTGWQRQTAMEQMENFLNTNSVAEIESIQAIWTHDDEIVFGIVEALRNYNGPADINIEIINGVAANKEFMALIEDSGLDIDFISSTFSPSMVRDAVDLGYEAMMGETLDKKYLVPTEIIDESNYEDYMKGDLYTTRYSL